MTLRHVKGALVALAVAFAGARPLLAQCPDGSPGPCRPTRPAPAAASVAVLNFENRSRDTADAFFAEGIADEITNLLTKVGRLTVISRPQVRRLRGSADMDMPAVGRALNAANLVTGSVQSTPTRLRISVELLRSAGGVQLWGQSYDRARTDLLDIQTDIATQVATAIAGALRPGERATLARTTTHNPQANEHVMRGNLAIQQRNTERISNAIEEYRAATRLDPGSAAIAGRLAFAYALCAVLNYSCLGLTRDSLVALGDRTARAALARDSSVSEAWLAWGEVNLAAGNRVEELRGYRRATRLDSLSADAWRLYGYFMWQAGHDSVAEASFRRALRIDPAHAITYETFARLRLSQGRLEETAALLDTAIRIAPQFPFPWLARARLRAWLGDTAGAHVDVETRERIEPGPRSRANVAATMAFAMTVAGDSARARMLTDSLLRDSTAYAEPLWIALWRQGRFADFWQRVAMQSDGGPRVSYESVRYPWYREIAGDPRMRAAIAARRSLWNDAVRQVEGSR